MYIDAHISERRKGILKGTVFCYIPLIIKLNLANEISANFSACAENRRTLTSHDDGVIGAKLAFFCVKCLYFKWLMGCF